MAREGNVACALTRRSAGGRVPPMPSTSKERPFKVTVTMSREERSKLLALAKRLRRSQADAIREAIDRELGRAG